ncbi:hypothetical protein GLYMA_10G213300v4 [Glycine max]|uniref:Uncharacterized protein n=1 Tax=Glycine max TaxID=3847 RepID=C6T5B7_SOYBN|nr:uncharacterized protein LOC100527759 [Glycine max]ACU16919.1 unknown [Glycine max]KAH1139409.1 hypothetical protein GYH30_028694 [Glycine max]KRH34911.1 hypothetical protein GLYMA_10G213300v4 [Glycine max]|eukprot:NP_001236967.1 uncharacterized protein LOC100527759 [Glycine max]
MKSFGSGRRNSVLVLGATKRIKKSTIYYSILRWMSVWCATCVEPLVGIFIHSVLAGSDKLTMGILEANTPTCNLLLCIEASIYIALGGGSHRAMF